MYSFCLIAARSTCIIMVKNVLKLNSFQVVFQKNWPSVSYWESWEKFYQKLRILKIGLFLSNTVCLPIMKILKTDWDKCWWKFNVDQLLILHLNRCKTEWAKCQKNSPSIFRIQMKFWYLVMLNQPKKLAVIFFGTAHSVLQQVILLEKN